MKNKIKNKTVREDFIHHSTPKIMLHTFDDPAPSPPWLECVGFDIIKILHQGENQRSILNHKSKLFSSSEPQALEKVDAIK